MRRVRRAPGKLDTVINDSAPLVFHPELLAGRKALVTGGGTGLGRAIALGLLRAGADVTIAARRSDVLDTAAGELSTIVGRHVATDLVDIRDRVSVEALAER